MARNQYPMIQAKLNARMPTFTRETQLTAMAANKLVSEIRAILITTLVGMFRTRYHQYSPPAALRV